MLELETFGENLCCGIRVLIYLKTKNKDYLHEKLNKKDMKDVFSLKNIGTRIKILKPIHPFVIK